MNPKLYSMSKEDLDPGKLIVFEGPNGVGKSTISRKVLDILRTDGLKCELLTFPGQEKGSLGRMVYQIHHELGEFGLKRLTPTSLQTLHLAAHFDLIEHEIKPMLEDGTTVLLDRYWWSTWVYGLVGGVKSDILETMIALERKIWAGIVPLLGVLIRRDSPIDRQASISRWNNLRREYDRLVEREGRIHEVLIVENNGMLEMSAESIALAVRSKLSVDLEDMAIQEGPNIECRHITESDQIPAPVPSHISPIQPSVVYDSFWRFAAERQNIFFKRFTGNEQPWTDDPILSANRFTNAYRACDRTSQFLIRHVIYREDLPATDSEILFRILLFKSFNLIETWDFLEQSIGSITLADYSFDRYDQLLSNRIETGGKIYSGAYIMPPGKKSFGHARKHQNHLALIDRMMSSDLSGHIAQANSMQEGFEILLDYPMIGGFLAYQLITDINYSEITNFSEMEFVMPGPGALDGIQKCFANLGGLNEPEIIKFMVDRQELEFDRLGLDFQQLWGRRLQLIDCQNLFCEVDKYARVRHPEIEGLSGRKRIKRRFKPNSVPLPVWFPPKWGLNERIIEGAYQLSQ